jgi:hypothetical protein
MLVPILLLTNLAATLFMTGLIWFVQIVHYAMFGDVGRDGFAAYHTRHMARTTWVVAPVMIAEGISGVLFPFFVDASSKPLAWLALALLLLVWVSTFAMQVPRHNQLHRDGFDLVCCERLCRTNWIRTVGWTSRAIVLLVITWRFVVR